MALENLALRQQLAVLRRQTGERALIAVVSVFPTVRVLGCDGDR